MEEEAEAKNKDNINDKKDADLADCAVATGKEVSQAEVEETINEQATQPDELNFDQSANGKGSGSQEWLEKEIIYLLDVC